MMAAMSEDSGLGNMDPYGLRAMQYVRDHCPSRYASIEDPVSFFSTLGEHLRDEVMALEPTLAASSTTVETWPEEVGRRTMARLMAEERIFSEFYESMPPELDPTEDDDWEPLMPDMSDIIRAEVEDS